MSKIVASIAFGLLVGLFSPSLFAQNQKTFNVVIDAGHGGKDYGAQTGTLNEKDLTLAISKKIAELNSDKNIRVIFTRDADDFTTLDHRVESTKNTDLMISLHVSISNENVSGMEIYYPREGEFSKKSKQFGYILSQSFNDYEIHLNSLKMEPANFYVLRSANCPAVLIELGFLSNEDDVAYLTTESNQEEIANAILQSIESMIPEE